MAKRWSATFKGSGAPTRQNGSNNTVFWYMADDATDVQGQAVADAIAGLSNGSLVSVSKQIYSNLENGPWASLTANGGSDRARCLMRSATKRAETITIPFLKHTIEKAEIEAVLENGALGILNSAGEALGSLVNIQQSEVVDG